LGRAGPGWDAVVDEVGEVGDGVVDVGRRDRRATGVGAADAVADERAVLVDVGGDLRRVDSVAGHRVPAGAVVAHRHVGPVGLVLRVVDGDVLPGQDG